MGFLILYHQSDENPAAFEPEPAPLQVGNDTSAREPDPDLLRVDDPAASEPDSYPFSQFFANASLYHNVLLMLLDFYLVVVSGTWPSASFFRGGQKVWQVVCRRSHSQLNSVVSLQEAPACPGCWGFRPHLGCGPGPLQSPIQFGATALAADLPDPVLPVS